MDIDLGQHELVDDVLSVDVHTCIAQYVTSVSTTTPLPDRAGAVFEAIENVKPIGSMLNPIAEMEGVSAGALPDLGAFLPRWVKRLGRCRPSKDEWESDHERWLREAVLRLDGVNGLERLARKTKRHRRASRGVRRWWNEAIGAAPFTRTTPPWCSWASRIGVVNFWMVRRWPLNN